MTGTALLANTALPAGTALPLPAGTALPASTAVAERAAPGDAAVPAIATTSGPIQLSAATRNELTKRLGWLHGGDTIIERLTRDGGAPAAFDAREKQRIFDELAFWLSNPGKQPFSDDARSLYRALAGEVHQR